MNINSDSPPDHSGAQNTVGSSNTQGGVDPSSNETGPNLMEPNHSNSSNEISDGSESDSNTDRNTPQSSDSQTTNTNTPNQESSTNESSTNQETTTNQETPSTTTNQETPITTTSTTPSTTTNTTNQETTNTNSESEPTTNPMDSVREGTRAYRDDFISHLHDLFRGTTGQTTSASTESPDNRNNSAIIITINYVFSDENNPASPNRSGSLVLTLPNNAANRDPRVIEEFIRLATQMAYSTIVNNGQLNKGITVEAFDKFPQKSLEQIPDQTCSICLENFITINNVNVNVNVDEEIVTSKRRKLNDETISPIASTDSIEPPTNKKFLSDLTAEYPHIPVEMPCGHIFGKSCLCEWLKNHTTCPLCRKPIVEEESNRIPSNNLQSSDFGIDNLWNAEGSGVRLVGRTGFDELLNLLSNRFRNDENTPSSTTTSTANPTTTPNTEPASSTASSSIIIPHIFRHSRHRPATTGPTTTAPDTTTPRPTTTSPITNNSRPTISRTRNDQGQGHGIFSNILTYFRRRDSEPNMFPSGVSSRRTADGTVRTTTTGDFHSGTGVIDLPPPGSGTESNSEGIRAIRRFLTVNEFANLRNTNPILYNHLFQPPGSGRNNSNELGNTGTTTTTENHTPNVTPNATPDATNNEATTSTNDRNRASNLSDGSSVSAEDEILDYLNLRTLTDDPEPNASADNNGN